MTEEQLIKFLKENMHIQIYDKTQLGSKIKEQMTIEVTIKGQVIATDTIYL